MIDTKQAKLHFDNACAFLQRGKIDEAIGQLSMAISIDGRPEYYFHRAHLYLERADFNGARQDLNKAEQLLRQGQTQELSFQDVEALRAQINNPVRTGSQDRRGQLTGYAEKRQLEPMLQELGLGAYTAQLKALMQPSVRMKPTGGTAPTAGSKLGGFPDLPPKSEWPRSSKGVPMALICQINLAQLAQVWTDVPIPKMGVIYAFFDAAAALRGEQGEFRVVMHGNPEQVINIHAPDCTPQENTFFEAAVALVKEDCLPDWDHPSIQKLLPPELRPSYEQLLSVWYGPQPWHRLLGYSQGVQSALEAELGDVFRLFIQIDTDHDACLEWGRDGGRLYFAMANQRPLTVDSSGMRAVLQTR